MNEKFWLTSPADLFYNSRVIPSHDQTTEQQMNALTRLVILTVVILLLVGFSHSITILVLALLFIIMMYYIKTKGMERYMYDQNTDRFCKSAVIIEPDKPSTFLSSNQKLANGYDTGEFRNPTESKYQLNRGLARTRVPPLIIPPAYSDFWKKDELVVFQGINKQTTQDLHQSGYIPDKACEEETVETYTADMKNKVRRLREERDKMQNTRNFSMNSYKFPDPTEGTYIEFVDQKLPYTTDMVPESDLNRPTQSSLFPYYKDVKPNEFGSTFGDMDTSDGYYPDNLEYNLPVNKTYGACQKNKALANLNANMNVEYVDPDVLVENQVIEPISSNIGISFDQQFEPMTKKTYGKVDVYTNYDPRQFRGENPENKSDDATYYNVYDPRFEGYGTSYRHYIDEITGQPRFFYDDVDAIRKPNYIVRSNVDHLSDIADTYGPMRTDADIEKWNNNRKYVEAAYTNAQLQFRNELQVRLMNKRNNEMIQLREKPLLRTYRR